MKSGKKHLWRESSNPVVYQWNPSLQSIYCNKFLGAECTNLYENLLCKITDVDNNPMSAVDILITTCISKQLLMGFSVKERISIQPLFRAINGTTTNVKLQNVDYMIYRKKGITEDNRSTYQRLMREYKALIQRKKRNYHLAIAADVKHLHQCDPQGYWCFWKRFKPSH